MVESQKEGETQTAPLLRLLLEVGPLVCFFFANSKYGIIPATKVFMAVIVISLLVSWRLEKRLPVMALFTAVFVLIMGGLTWWLNDEWFIKVKPTIANTFFGLMLLGGMAFGHFFLKTVFGTAFELSGKGWRILTIRWGVFMLLLAVLNEFVWRNYTTDEWVAFKSFGLMPLTLVFSMAQIPVLNRHSLETEDGEADS